MFKTPVLFLVFNRPDVTVQVFEAIRKAKPPRLYVAADGPRKDRPGESENCIQVRQIATQVDWPCEVKTLFRDQNLGCRHAVSSAIDWFFENELEGIILEDDCLPHPSFFRFCDELLERYRFNLRIGQVGGGNFQFGFRHNDQSYYFSKYTHIWGWATWRDRWQGTFDISISDWPNVKKSRSIKPLLNSSEEWRYWSRIFNKVYNKNIDTWDYQWLYANWMQDRLTVLPNVNLISNIGFSEEAAHTKSNDIMANLPVFEMVFPLKHPPAILQDIVLDDRSFKRIFKRSLYQKVVDKLRIVMN